MIGTLLEALGVGLIALGIAVTSVTVYGVVRLRGLYSRLQAASKASMLGTVAILAASVGTRDGATIARAAVVALFLLLTTPIAAHAIAQAAYRRDREGESGGVANEREGGAADRARDRHGAATDAADRERDRYGAATDADAGATTGDGPADTSS